MHFYRLMTASFNSMALNGLFTKWSVSFLNNMDEKYNHIHSKNVECNHFIQIERAAC